MTKDRSNQLEGLIFDIQRFSLHDGPGIRTVIFFKGCPLNCAWCANPEGQDSFINFLFLKDKCKNECFECVKYCKQNAIKKSGDKVSIDYSKCNFCEACVEKCSRNALKKVGEWNSIDEIITIILKDIKFYEKSGGGVTFSVGEPTRQIGFLKILVDRLKKLNIDLCLETCGSFDYHKSVDILKKMDLIYFDLKVIDDGEARLYTGSDISVIKQNLAKLSNIVGKKITVKVPLISGMTTKEQNLFKIKEILNRYNLNNIELLPFHKLGTKKYEMLGRKNKIKDIELLSEAELESHLKFFNSFNVIVER